MSNRRRLLAISAAVALSLSAMLSVPALSEGFGDVLKGAGVVLLVNKFGDDINKFVNKLTLNKGVGVEDRTAVVPIFSVGKGAYIGAAQVSGPAHLVDRVKAVAQLESTMAGRGIRVRALVPVESKEIVKDIKRVSGVGVSAMIDTSIRL